MVNKALVVDDDPDVREEVAEILDSMGHAYDMAASQSEGRQLFAENEYSYYLLDLEIPIRQGGLCRIQNGENLLGEILKHRGLFGPPVIVITGHGKGDPRLARKVFTAGAVDFVNKPFATTGETLDVAIRDALARQAKRRRLATCENAPQDTAPRVDAVPFRGGEMVFYPDRVELCGVKILGGPDVGYMRRILDELRAKRSNGRFVAYSGTELSLMLGTVRGQNAISGCIRDFRDKAIEILLKEAGVICKRQDIVRSGSQGYRFNDWITIRTEETPRPSEGNSDGPANESAGHSDAPENGLTNAENGRQRWILEQLDKGTEIRCSTVADQFQCSPTTVKRDLARLRKRGLIRFDGPTKTGFYRLSQKKPR